MNITPEQARDLDIAREMSRRGIPVFVCPPHPHRPGKYLYPGDWQNTPPDPTIIDRWRPGWGIGAVGGGAADFIDMDPRSGGIESQTELKNAGQWPMSFGQQATPSGGTHDVISRTGERKETAFMPGLDFQAGGTEPDERGSYGRAFVWIAPTVGLSKETGELVPYRWVHPPDLDALDEWRSPDGTSSDATTEGVVARVYAKRASKSPARAGVVDPGGSAFGALSQVFTNGVTRSPFTRTQAEEFLEPHYRRLIEARIGEIEERGMDFTLAIERFVPAFWTAEEAYRIILGGLAHTAYDPNGPSDWTADKFLARLDGRRPVSDSWKAARAAESVTEVIPELGAVDALLAEMRKPAELITQLPPRPLIRGLLNLDSESWIIGAPGSKKSFVATDMAGHVAHGMPWQGRRVHAARVVMIVAEGAGGLGPRLRAWEMEHGRAMSDDVFILPRPVQAANFEKWAVLVEACRRIGPGLVVLDTQARMTVGLEENSAKEMGVFIAAVSAVREATGACVLTVHHTGRAGGDARGSSAIDGAQTTELKVVAEKGALHGKLISEKQKDMKLADDIDLVFAVHAVGADEDGEPITSLALISDSYRKVAGQGDVPRPEEVWEAPVESVRELVLQVLADHGEDRGVTSADAKRIVLERWYGGKADRLQAGTWRSAWNRAIKEERVINVGGERFTVDRLNDDDVS